MPTPSASDSLIEYPCQFPIKVMGHNVPGFVEAMLQLAQQFDPALDPATLEPVSYTHLTLPTNREV